MGMIIVYKCLHTVLYQLICTQIYIFMQISQKKYSVGSNFLNRAAQGPRLQKYTRLQEEFRKTLTVEKLVLLRIKDL